MKTSKELIDNLRRVRPHIAVSVVWERDPYFAWDGDGEDPEDWDNPQYPHDVTVTVSRIEKGELLEGHAYLGGSYSDLNGPHCPEIHGYFPQLLDEALQDLAGEIERTGS